MHTIPLGFVIFLVLNESEKNSRFQPKRTKLKIQNKKKHFAKLYRNGRHLRVGWRGEAFAPLPEIEK